MHPRHGGSSYTPPPGARYEKQDLTPQAAAITLFGLAVLAAFAAASIWLSKSYLLHIAPARVSKFTTSREAVRPAEPRLQANPVQDIKTFREQEAYVLNTYSRDPISRRLHIPVDRAMEIVAKEGLPTRPNPAQPDPMEPNEPSYTIGQSPSDQLPQATVAGPNSSSASSMAVETYHPGVSSNTMP